MFRIIILFFISLFLHTCSLIYDGESRLLVEGKILDENGNPMANVYVSAHAKKDGIMFFTPSENDLISYDLTDDSGNFKMMFPSPINEDEIAVFINYDELNPTYSKTVFYNIQNPNFEDQELNLVNSLYEVDQSVELTIGLEEDLGIQILGWNLEGKVAENHYNLSPIDLESDVYFDHSSSNLVGKNQNIILQYYYKDLTTSEIFAESVSIEIQDQPVHYEITF